jgi:Uri superfamily endonuclease
MEKVVPGFTLARDTSRIKASADYVLLLYYDEDMEVEVGALGRILMKKGTYAYCGSAKAGLKGRIKRHLSTPVKKRWHIDYIASVSGKRAVHWNEHEPDGECRAADHLARTNESVPGFGCSDCKCGSHLFYLGSEDVTESKE